MKHKHSFSDRDFAFFWNMTREGQASHLKYEHKKLIRTSNPPRQREREEMHYRDHKVRT